MFIVAIKRGKTTATPQCTYSDGWLIYLVVNNVTRVPAGDVK
jgi:hypothetical protein